jgi:hypothetical protein
LSVVDLLGISRVLFSSENKYFSIPSSTLSMSWRVREWEGEKERVRGREWEGESDRERVRGREWEGESERGRERGEIRCRQERERIRETWKGKVRRDEEGRIE